MLKVPLNINKTY